MGLVLVLITQGGTALAQDLEGEATATSMPIQGPLLPTTPEPITTPVPGAPAGDVPESGTIADDSGQKVPAKGSETNPNAQQDPPPSSKQEDGKGQGTPVPVATVASTVQVLPESPKERAGWIPAPLALVAVAILGLILFLTWRKRRIEPKEERKDLESVRTVVSPSQQTREKEVGMSQADAITPVDTERMGMWPEDLAQRLDRIQKEVGELEATNQQTGQRRAVVEERTEELEQVVVRTRTELTARDAGLTKTSGYLDRLAGLVASFRSRIGLDPKAPKGTDGATENASPDKDKEEGS